MKYTKCLLIIAAFFLFSASFIVAEGVSETDSLGRPRSYYVAADGSDSNNGLSEQNAFKTLARAVEFASKDNIKRITVIGVLDGATEASRHEDSVFFIGDSGSEAITISGRPGADPGAALRGGDGKRVISILGNSHIRFEHIRITGGVTEDEGGGIYCEGGVVVLGEGAVLSGNVSSEGGGVYVREGTLILRKDAAISDNTVSTDEGGGAVILMGIFNMEDDSQISGNSGGGLILVGSEGAMNDDAAIIGNTCEFDGGGVMVYLSNFTMRGSSRVSGNQAGNNGGGVQVKFARLMLYDEVSINENEAGNDGGGVNLEAASMFAQGYAEIAGNRSGDDGGGIHCQGGYVILAEYMTLLNNEAPCGGGLCIENYSSAIIRDEVAVSGNRAIGHDHQGGGGLCAGYNSNIHMLGGEVFDNTSDRGGGVYLEEASLVLDAGYITNNQAGEGGGIYAKAKSLVRISNESLVKDNSPDNIEQK